MDKENNEVVHEIETIEYIHDGKKVWKVVKYDLDTPFPLVLLIDRQHNEAVLDLGIVMNCIKHKTYTAIKH